MKKYLSLTCATIIAGMSVMGGVTTFAAEEDSQASSATTDVKAVFIAPETQNPNPVGPDGVKPTDPGYNDKNDNKNLDPQGNFGLAYVPKTFDFGTHELTEKGNFKAKKATSFDVGVKDTTYGTTGWKVTATLSELKNEKNEKLAGASLSTTSDATVNVNKNAGGDVAFTPSDLTPVSNGEATTSGNVSINASESPIMSGVTGKIHKSVYNLGLGDVTLNIPDMDSVSTGTYSGTVNWNLAVAE
ncbi:WxL domain-containing protein [Enterococcus faecalis]|uniref:WxL domain-containing protein n=1 Tax=Enterococcus faecalis TaxID=1351 RepID=UPI00177CF2D9|nr:WxL domain-containing protein [Enterococcus faecalis]MBD9891336.1 WxL domain-containing protein [Enterococcus faecalis]